MSAQVAVYVQSKYAKPAYTIESYNVRAWPGLEMICHALRQAGIEVDYCSSATVGRYKVVLVSITSGCDWYPFVMERLAWPKSAKPTVVAGGAGLLNVRPFLRWCDTFCLGRADQYVVPVVQAALAGERYEHPSVIHAADFDVNKTYIIDAGGSLYPHAVPLANGKTWQESAYGCQRKCLFCAYIWHRRHVGGLQNEAGAGDVLWGGSAEKTIFELDLANPDTWGLPKLRIVGLDGFSERLRRMVNKPITRDMLRGFFRGLASSGVKPNHMKIYNIVGYPTETEADWFEFLEDLAAADEGWSNPGAPGDPQWGVEVHSTPFRPMPATPCACWPMNPVNYRGRIVKVLRQGKHSEYTGIFYRGNRFWAAESRGTESRSRQRAEDPVKPSTLTMPDGRCRGLSQAPPTGACAPGNETASIHPVLADWLTAAAGIPRSWRLPAPECPARSRMTATTTALPTCSCSRPPTPGRTPSGCWRRSRTRFSTSCRCSDPRRRPIEMIGCEREENSPQW